MSHPIQRKDVGLGVELISRHLFQDHRGTFSEIWNSNEFGKVGLDFRPQQFALSHSKKGVLRGLHIQAPSQLKLICLVSGHTFHVGVDLRAGSKTFGQHVCVELTPRGGEGLLLPKGFAHGFVALEESTIGYLCDEIHQAKTDWSIRWNDPSLAIDWPIVEPVLSERDSEALSFKEMCGLLETKTCGSF